MLKVHLFGSGEASHDEHALSGFPGQQHGLLFCYLLLNRNKPITRERLAAVFWGDYDTPIARKYLRNSLWRLKQSLIEAGLPPDNAVMTDPESVTCRSANNTWLDVAVFEDAARSTQRTRPEALSDLQVDALEAAVVLYRGDLLDGVYADWTLYERERLRLLYLGMRQKLMLHHSTYGRFDAAVAHAESILAIDPAREKIHRQLMRLQALSGDRNAALAQYKRCKQILREELNLAPMKETRLLYRQIKENTFDRDQPAVETAEAGSASILLRLHGLQRLANRLHNELRSLEKLINADS